MESKTKSMKEEAYRVPKEACPGLWEGIAHYLQILNLTHAWCNIFACILKPFVAILTYYQGVRGNEGPYLYRKRRIHGENFVCAGGVWMCNFHDIKRLLVEPQARTFMLASSALDPQHQPMIRERGRNVMLLSLSQRGAGGNGDWEAFRGALEDYIFNTEDAMLRSKDDTTQRLFDQLGNDYKTSNQGRKKTFFTSQEFGLLPFLLKYLHYVFLGIDPTDESLISELIDFHYDNQSAAYHLKGLGNCFQCFFFRNWPKEFKKMTERYAESPVISMFESKQSKYNNMTRHELAGGFLTVMCLAGLVGPRTLAVTCLGQRKLNAYERQETHSIDVTTIWDTLNLDDREEVKRYVYECARLRNPVSNTHCVATQDFEVKIGRRNRTFRKGTTIFIPLIMVGINEKVWGQTTFRFDHNRPNLCPYATVFNSFGNESNGRICPGRKVAETLMIDILIALGKIRRGARTKTSSTASGIARKAKAY
ncbi:hypothetical protein ACA910_016695 [Epithemia clementina (nom. ined.)]